MKKKSVFPPAKNRIRKIYLGERIRAFAGYMFLDVSGTSQFRDDFEVSVDFSNDPANTGEDRVTVERKLSKSYLIDRVLYRGGPHRKECIREPKISILRLLDAHEPIDEVMKTVSEILARQSSVHIEVRPEFSEMSLPALEICGDSKVEIAVTIADWEGGAIVPLSVVCDYLVLDGR